MVNFWQISPGRESRGFWTEFRSHNIIAIGWPNLGDLSNYSSAGDIERGLREHYPEDYPDEIYPCLEHGLLLKKKFENFIP